MHGIIRANTYERGFRIHWADVGRRKGLAQRCKALLYLLGGLVQFKTMSLSDIVIWRRGKLKHNLQQY